MNTETAQHRTSSRPEPRRIRHVRVQDELWHQAAEKATLEGVTISEKVRELLAEYLRD
jgi:hypothetical protein